MLYLEVFSEFFILIQKYAFTFLNLLHFAQIQVFLFVHCKNLAANVISLCCFAVIESFREVLIYTAKRNAVEISAKENGHVKFGTKVVLNLL